MFEAGHIVGALHLDMDRHLAAPPGEGGRHPLPAAEDFADLMSRHGADSTVTVVAYDEGGGSGAARLWWLLRHFGHQAVVVLDGGLAAWQVADQPLESGPGHLPERRRFEVRPRSDDVMDTDELQAAIGRVHVIDARGAERWRGEVEPVDPVPGRIPGSLSAPAGDNIQNGRFRPAAELRSYYERLGVTDGRPIVASCGSGVNACVDLLALELAGVRGAKLNPGSYSGWLAKGLPVEKD